MKKFFATAMLSLCAIMSSSLLFAQNPNPISTCFVDNYGCVYHLSLYEGDKIGCHTSIGVVTMEEDGEEKTWAVLGNGCFDVGNGEQNGTVHFVAYNPARDNCATDVDSIVYDGTMKWIRNSGEISGSGTWVKYCGGNVVSSGNWTATGPCDDDDDKATQGSKKAGNNFSFSVVPNPANSSSVIQYSLSKTSSVGITIYNYNNQLIKVMASQIRQAGQYSANWNLTDAAGRKVSPGLYKVVVTVDGTQYSQTVQVL